MTQKIFIICLFFPLIACGNIVYEWKFDSASEIPEEQNLNFDEWNFISETGNQFIWGFFTPQIIESGEYEGTYAGSYTAQFSEKQNMNNLIELLSPSFALDGGEYNFSMELNILAVGGETDHFYMYLEDLDGNQLINQEIWNNDGIYTYDKILDFHLNDIALAHGTYQLRFLLDSDGIFSHPTEDDLYNQTTINLDNIRILIPSNDPVVTVPAPAAAGLSIMGLALLRRLRRR